MKLMHVVMGAMLSAPLMVQADNTVNDSIRLGEIVVTGTRNSTDIRHLS